MKITKDWEFGVLGLYNYNRPGPFETYFDFIRENHKRMDGDFVEAGVFRGRSALALALFLKELGSDKKVYGFDTFSGFVPEKNPKDDFKNFDRLFQEKRITAEHYGDVKKNIAWREALLGQSVTPKNISTSGDFSDTSLQSIQQKAKILGLDNLILMQGPFSETMTASQKKPEKIMGVMLDCDLYDGYMQTFGFCWPRMVSGAMVFLDEYFSLKFPGARLATDQFLSDKQEKPTLLSAHEGDFERWGIFKSAA
ncbi:MAG: methyltransferase [Alphaproteobacteria bacterium PRO2]|nr:methyltransferase [Alphaproteobacteria bacterium PRO2]